MTEVRKDACVCAEAATEEELLARLDAVLADYKDTPGALIPVLQITQSIFGYLPEPALKKIAETLGKSFSEVAGVVGFYSFFTTQPRGKHLVRVCLGTACYVRGGAEIARRLTQTLGVEVGQTTADRKFTLEVMRCIGACGLAPAMTINDEVIRQVNPDKLNRILAKCD